MIKDTKIHLILPPGFWQWSEAERINFVDGELRKVEIRLPNIKGIKRETRLDEIRKNKIVYEVIYLEVK